MKKLRKAITCLLMATMISVTGATSLTANAETWNSKPKLSVGVQSGTGSTAFAIKVYRKDGAVKYKVQEKGQDITTGKWNGGWKTVKTYKTISGSYRRFVVKKNANDKYTYHYRVIAYNSNGDEVITKSRVTPSSVTSVKVKSGNDSKTGEQQNVITWKGGCPTSFQVWRATSKNGEYHKITGYLTENSYTDTNVSEGVTYY